MTWWQRVLLGLGAFLLFTSITIALLLIQVANRQDAVVRIVEITPGESAKSVADKLYAAHLIQGRVGFLLVSRLLGVGEKLQAGRYALSPRMSNLEIIMAISRGETAKPDLVTVTFPEGQSIYKMSVTLQKAGLSCSADFERLVGEPIDPQFRSDFPFIDSIPVDSLEGYLFPDTYKVDPKISATELARVMLRRFSEMVVPLWESKRSQASFSLHQILTLASIVEKEAQVAPERPVIASAFLNRLKIGMKLDADPTVKYSLTLPHKLVRLEDLRVQSPYNTYINAGLPPGPICNPGLESIRAALEPAKTTYLYFVATPDGHHIFSKTFEEHQKARRKSGT